MAIALTDAEISEFIAEIKPLPHSFERRFALKSRHGHTEAQLDIETVTGNRYRLQLRQSQFNRLDFSAIIGYYLPGSNRIFRLRRYNGKSHEHTNTIEREKFYDFHIHIATERYQLIGADEEKFAVMTDRYATLYQAFECLRLDCAVELPQADSGQGRLF